MTPQYMKKSPPVGGPGRGVRGSVGAVVVRKGQVLAGGGTAIRELGPDGPRRDGALRKAAGGGELPSPECDLTSRSNRARLCLGAIVQARIRRLVPALDPKAGAVFRS